MKATSRAVAAAGFTIVFPSICCLDKTDNEPSLYRCVMKTAGGA